MNNPLQTFHDTFYAKNGPCCSGCDWWQAITAKHGDCTKTAPNFSGEERMIAVGISWASTQFEAGHMVTKFNHKCGDFKDDFDWSSLGELYLKRISGSHLANRNPTP